MFSLDFHSRHHVESGFLQEDIGFYQSFHDSIWFHNIIRDWTHGSFHFVNGKSHRFRSKSSLAGAAVCTDCNLDLGVAKISRVDGQKIADQLQDVSGKGQKIYKANGTKKGPFWIVLVFSGICWYIFTGLRLVALKRGYWRRCA